MTVMLSERAAKEVKRMMSDQHLPDSTFLRVGVVGGGCSGFEYRLEFTPDADQGKDLVTESHGVRIAVDPKSANYLRGTQIDIEEGLNKRGFVFSNPLAVRTCGCGTSFST
jgi:iron-sulfur cluster assembly accessory protein